MKTNSQSGISFIQIILVLAVITVLLGVLGILTDSNQTTDLTQVEEDTLATDSPLETMAENSATSETVDMQEAIVDQNAELEVATDPTSQSQTNDSDLESDIASEPGTFSAYSADKLALASNGTVVLFFHANWCPSCRTLESDINASLNDIPANTHILKLDYDTETELKRKYGVVRQHTIVVVDAEGNELKKLTGLTNTLEQVVNQL